MNRNDLCELLGLPRGGRDFIVRGVTQDSRRVQPGWLFVAVEGLNADGHAFADDAVHHGAAVVLGNRKGCEEWAGVPYVYSADPREAAGLIAHALQGNPSAHMTVVGITGTNGKSSTARLVQGIFETAGYVTANFGTLGYSIAGETETAALTTPGADVLAPLFARARESGCTHVVMEVSSHALEQERVAGIDFDVAAFTNLTEDHLDYHADMNAYRDAKLKLFELADRFAVVNADDSYAHDFASAASGACYEYGFAEALAERAGDVAVYAEDIETQPDHTRFHLKTPWGEGQVALRLIGRHNISNALCAAAIAGGLGIPIGTVCDGLNAVPAVLGRFEPVNAGQDFLVVVDYAHTPDALQNVLEAARPLCTGKLICVFGCGGDRDRFKRPLMGRIAAEMADFVVLTSDNPRSENPERIIQDIEEGVTEAGLEKGSGYVVIEQRRDAIEEALRLAQAGDAVLIAGKGHEDYQIIGDKRIHFDDREEARKALEKL